MLPIFNPRVLVFEVGSDIIISDNPESTLLTLKQNNCFGFRRSKYLLSLF
jgi:hypothetical protein